MSVKISPQALRDIRTADAWWRANRPAAPALLREELRQAFRLLESHQDSGAPALDPEARGVRRLYLRGSRYFLYYSSHDSDVEVLRLWHVSRGDRPKL